MCFGTLIENNFIKIDTIDDDCYYYFEMCSIWRDLPNTPSRSKVELNHSSIRLFLWLLETELLFLSSTFYKATTFIPLKFKPIIHSIQLNPCKFSGMHKSIQLTRCKYFLFTPVERLRRIWESTSTHYTNFKIMWIISLNELQ